MLICGYRNQTTEFWNYGGVEDHDSKILACRFDNANDAIGDETEGEARKRKRQ